MDFRREGLSPSLSLLMSTFSLLISPPDRLRAGFTESSASLRILISKEARDMELYHRTLRYHAHRCASRASAHGLSPDTSSPQDSLSRPVSCYAIFKGWLLLSPPPGCFRLPTPFRITLDRNLGTLTVVWVVSLMATKLTPDGLTPDVYDERKFGV